MGIDTRALKALTRSPLAIDLYVWLTYRMSYLREPTTVPWELLALQTRAHYREVRQFRRRALELADVDLVANDTGGAVAQVFAADHPERLHTLTLTNCEAHDNLPPKALLPTVLLARMGLLARIAPRQVRDIPRARKRFYGSGYQDVANLPDDIARAWLQPLFGTRESARQFQRLLTSLHARDLLAAEPALAGLQVPTLIVWGTADRFFRRRWAYWLRDTIPGATEVVEIDGGRLFFPDERATELTAALRHHWDTHPGTGSSY